MGHVVDGPIVEGVGPLRRIAAVAEREVAFPLAHVKKLTGYQHKGPVSDGPGDGDNVVGLGGSRARRHRMGERLYGRTVGVGYVHIANGYLVVFGKLVPCGNVVDGKDTSTRGNHHAVLHAGVCLALEVDFGHRHIPADPIDRLGLLRREAVCRTQQPAALSSHAATALDRPHQGSMRIVANLVLP
jgi:hypothetical protein